MKYLGEEKRVEVRTLIERPVEYVRCDRCAKKIIPYQNRDARSRYVHIHTFHNDWGNDSVDSHEYLDFCLECAKTFVSEYIDDMAGTEELEFENKYLTTNETARLGDHSMWYYDEYDLVIDDHHED